MYRSGWGGNSFVMRFWRLNVSESRDYVLTRRRKLRTEKSRNAVYRKIAKKGAPNSSSLYKSLFEALFTFTTNFLRCIQHFTFLENFCLCLIVAYMLQT